MEEKIITVSKGCYEIEDIEQCLRRQLPSNIVITLRSNNNGIRSEIKCNKRIDFAEKDSIVSILGFESRILEPDILHKSNLPVVYLKVKSLRIECNISTGAYVNGKLCRIIHEFFQIVPPGYKIIEVPA